MRTKRSTARTCGLPVLVAALLAAPPTADACTRISDADGKILSDRTNTRLWNDQAGKLVVAYNDPGGRKRWLRDAPRWIGGMRRAADGFTLQAALLEDPGLYRLLAPIATNYRSSVRAATQLYQAVYRRDAASEREAVTKLQRGGERSRALGRHFIVVLRRDYCP